MIWGYSISAGKNQKARGRWGNQQKRHKKIFRSLWIHRETLYQQSSLRSWSELFGFGRWGWNYFKACSQHGGKLRKEESMHNSFQWQAGILKGWKYKNIMRMMKTERWTLDSTFTCDKGLNMNHADGWLYIQSFPDGLLWWHAKITSRTNDLRVLVLYEK